VRDAKGGTCGDEADKCALGRARARPAEAGVGCAGALRARTSVFLSIGSSAVELLCTWGTRERRDATEGNR
jgi:hypothetical protein